MKKIVYLFGILLTANIMFAQTTAQNWTKTDCDGKSHNLFTDYLDQGKVVLMQFDMMNCALCTSAAYYTDQIQKDFQTSNPGRVVMFSLGYTNTTLCSQMNSWKTSNGFTFDMIEKCPDELAYYGQMGMPTIVIVAGGDHKVYYKKLGFKASDDASIRTVIDAALAATGMEENQNNMNSLSLYPNPATKTVHIEYSLKSATDVKVEVYNILGEKVQIVAPDKQSTGKHLIELNTVNLSDGIYIVNVNGQVLKLQVSN